jgi:hypothetical protein
MIWRASPFSARLFLALFALFVLVSAFHSHPDALFHTHNDHGCALCFAVHQPAASTADPYIPTPPAPAMEGRIYRPYTAPSFENEKPVPVRGPPPRA